MESEKLKAAEKAAILAVIGKAIDWREKMRQVDSTHWTGADCELMDAVDALLGQFGREAVNATR